MWRSRSVKNLLATIYCGLHKGVEQIRNGRAGPRGVVECGDRELAGRFNDMAQPLKALHQGVEEKTESRAKEIFGLSAALAPVAPADSVTQMMDRVIERIVEATGADAALIRIRDKATGEFTYVSQRGFPEYYLKMAGTVPPGSAVDRVFRSGNPVIASDIASDARYMGKLQLQAGFLSSALLPLRVRDEVRGIIHLASRKLGYFNEKERDYLITIARHMGIALENRELLEDSERRAQEQHALREFLANVLLSELDGLLQKMTEQAIVLFKADCAMFRLFDHRGKIKLRTVAGKKEVVERMARIPAETELIGRGRWMLDNRRPLADRDMTQHPDRIFATSRGVRAGLRGFLGAPLFSRDQKPLGVIHVMTSSPRDFMQRDLDLIEQFANGASIAIENARLIDGIMAAKGEVEKALAIKSQFVSTISHELRTPLSVILGNVSIIKDGLVGEINDEQDGRLQVIERNARDLLRLVQEILNISYLENGKMSLWLEEIDVAEFLQEIHSEFATLARKKGVSFEVQGNGFKRPLLSDRTKLREILHHLIGNAVKFTTQGKVRVEVHGLSDGDQVEFVVQDTGIGIKKESLSQIFDLFYQADGSNRREFGGAGLGLSIAKGLVELLEGEIRAESEPGKGSSFHVTLPRVVRIPSRPEDRAALTPGSFSNSSSSDAPGWRRPVV